MLEVLCSGSPSQVGRQHGSAAKAEIHRCIAFYRSLFQKKCLMDWDSVQEFALRYQSFLEENFLHYVSEIEGVAIGADVKYEEILALNVRTEIAFGAFSDGCTAISWKDESGSWLGQNWDWNTDQSENLINLKIQKDDDLSIQMITEAGVIGKIGLNSAGVGCTLNAIKAKGISFNKLPCHLALRTVMESPSREAAVKSLKDWGVASSCHILVADSTGGTGLECSSEDIVLLKMDSRGVVLHTNHYLLEHKSTVIEAPDWLKDTRFRLRRIGNLVEDAEKGPKVEDLERFLGDEIEGDGASICRRNGADGLATLFSIVMDLKHKEARVKVGRPSQPDKRVILRP